MKKHHVNLFARVSAMLPGVNIGYPILFFVAWMSPPTRDMVHLIIFYALLLAWLPLIGFSVYVFKKGHEKKIFLLGTIIWNATCALLLCALIAVFFIHYYHMLRHAV